jgi:large subunit ribosomal protein L13
MKKTYSAKKSEIARKWYVVDLEGQTLGRAASSIAKLLRGKHKPIFTPHVDTGDFVIAVNADKIHLSGNKAAQKTYYRHSGYIGNLKTQTAAEMLKKAPERVIRFAVRGMLPRNTLGRTQLKKLKVYAGPDHPHEAQQPKPYDLDDLVRVKKDASAKEKK